MKKIEAIIRPEVFQALREGLAASGFNGLTVSEAAGCGKQKGKQGLFRGTTFEVALSPRVKVEMIVEDSETEEIVDLICEYCSTGKVGDGKIFISDIEEVVRIRSKERGKQAFI
ncbi:P-II family nitrogen regulator [Rossellomorea vietnamensis]|uniref:P-II family nitrogen regulator n=2 Tax=Rossellomorea TaxID=2837508 RepID=A0A5D4KLU5_9BACI|nr:MULTISPECIES: P-II family nitrogen regulator [Rossellomorea]TYR77829.1 P-II family nitrogen regulator [Rossellomorea vietnamensis]TYS83341.1 P-II family nitrogen regulator [Rossellomorea aquimaris]